MLTAYHGLMAKIDPKREYNLTEIVNLRVFPYKDRRVIKRILMRNKSELQLQIIGTGKGLDYRIMGKHLIRLVKELSVVNKYLLTSNAKRI
jgi:hypothetical protein